MVSCIVQNETGCNITADSVDAEILKPDSSIEWVTMTEGSVGHYNGTFTNTSLDGAYNVTIYANKTGYVTDTAELWFEVSTLPVSSRTHNFSSLADTYVNSANPNANYGLATYLLAGTETWGSSTKTIYIKFNISSIPESAIILNASIYLRVGGRGFCGNPETISAYHVTNPTWNETTITYSIQPGFNLTAEDTLSVTKYWNKWTVTNMVKKEFYDGNKTISIALRGEGPGQCDKPFYSKESLESQYHPYLSVLAAVAPPTITSYAQESPVNDTVGNWRTFNVTLNQ